MDGQSDAFSDTKYPLKYSLMIFPPERELLKKHRSRTLENVIVIFQHPYYILIFGSTERLVVNPFFDLATFGNNLMEVLILIDSN